MESTVFAWLTEQGPVIAIFGVVIWYQTRRLDKAEEREREQIASRFEDQKEFLTATQAMTEALRALRETIAARS